MSSCLSFLLPFECGIVAVVTAICVIVQAVWEQGLVIVRVIIILGFDSRNFALHGVCPRFGVRVHQLPVPLLLGRREFLILLLGVTSGLDVCLLVHLGLRRESGLSGVR